MSGASMNPSVRTPFGAEQLAGELRTLDLP
jgi:hypothetical protein